MAVPLYPAISSGLPTRPGFTQSSLSWASKVYAGSRVQSPNFRGFARPNINFEFHNKVYRCIQSRTSERKPTRARINMMAPIGTPRVPYRNATEGTWQWIDVWNALYRERIIFVSQHIDEQFSNKILATMLYLESVDDTRKLFLYINGSGGDLTPSMALYDTMQCIKNPVCTHCMGSAYSMAAFLLAAGEKGYRSAMRSSEIRLVPPAGSARGQADNIQNEADELIRIRNYLFKQLSEHTGQPLDKIYEDLDRWKHLSAKEALEYGVIDHIVKPAIKENGQKDTTVGLG